MSWFSFYDCCVKICEEGLKWSSWCTFWKEMTIFLLFVQLETCRWGSSVTSSGWNLPVSQEEFRGQIVITIFDGSLPLICSFSFLVLTFSSFFPCAHHFLQELYIFQQFILPLPSHPSQPFISFLTSLPFTFLHLFSHLQS